MEIVSEIEIVPVNHQNGLVAFCRFVLFESLYCNSVAIMTKPSGGYRLLYPTKKIGDRNVNLFYPITKELGLEIEIQIIRNFKNIAKND